MRSDWRPNLSDPEVQVRLAPRASPYHSDDSASAELPPPVSTSRPLANFSKYNGSLLPLLKNSK